MNRAKVCGNCRFWDGYTEGWGGCHRSSPTLVISLVERVKADEADDNAEPEDMAVWPRTTVDDWCGEHEPKPVAPSLPQLIKCLDLSVRVRKAFTRMGITTIDELLAKTPDDFLEQRNFGTMCLEELRSELKRRGLFLKGDSGDIARWT